MSPTTPPRPISELRLGAWHLRLPAAPHPLVLRRDRPFDETAESVGVPDVIRYVATARRALRGPLVLEIEGPGDPLASPEVVLRSLSLLHERHPDVISGLVIDGPLLGEYAEDLVEFGLRYLVLRLDAATPETARRLVDGAWHRGDRFDRDEAAELLFDSGAQALRVAAGHDIPVIAQATLIPTVNAHEIGALAQIAWDCGAGRFQVVGHRPCPDGPLARAGTPTEDELLDARTEVARVFPPALDDAPRDEVLAWLAPERLRPVDLDGLDAVDVLRQLPSPDTLVQPAPVLPPRRAQLVAVATQDGSLVDTPLQGANLLRIYAVTPGTIRLLGSRPLPLDPRRRHDGVGSAQVFLQAIVGCRALVATQIPARAATLLQAVGVRPVALGGALDEVLDRVARGTVRQSGGEA